MDVPIQYHLIDAHVGSVERIYPDDERNKLTCIEKIFDENGIQNNTPWFDRNHVYFGV